MNEFLSFLVLKAAEVIPELGRLKQRAIPRLFRPLGNSLDTVLDLKCTITFS